MNKRIIIGARGSALSLAYVEKVKKLFKKTQVFSEEDIIFRKIKTTNSAFKPRDRERYICIGVDKHISKS